MSSWLKSPCVCPSGALYVCSVESVVEKSNAKLPIVSKTIPAGLIKYDESSLAVTAVDYNLVKEEDAHDHKNDLYHIGSGYIQTFPVKKYIF